MSGISIYPDNGPGRKLGPKEKKIFKLSHYYPIFSFL